MDIGNSFVIPAMGNKVTSNDVKNNQIRITKEFKSFFPNKNSLIKIIGSKEYECKYYYNDKRSSIIKLGQELSKELGLSPNCQILFTKNNDKTFKLRLFTDELGDEMLMSFRNIFLNSDIFKFPLKSNENLSYFKTLETKLTKFIEKTNELPSYPLFNKIKQNIHKIQSIKENLFTVIKQYLSGHSGSAYKTLERLLKSTLSSSLKDLVENNIDKCLYRLRTSDDILSNRKDMFHIPLSKRHLVVNKRYSIEGLPSLYLGSSIYSTWLELGSPNFDKLWVSAFKLVKGLPVLNFAYTIESFFEDYRQRKISDEKFISLFTLFPFVIACSFRTKYKDAKFNEEYIVPSLLLQWIVLNKSTEIYGLKYMTTRFSTYTGTAELGHNYVFPPSYIEEGYQFCKKLADHFTLTNPLPWELLEMLPPVDYIAMGAGIEAENIEDAFFKHYEYTKFGLIQQQVCSMDMNKVSNLKNRTTPLAQVLCSRDERWITWASNSANARFPLSYQRILQPVSVKF